MKAGKLSYLGVLTALAVSLNLLERMIPTPVPWVRLGLANLLTLVAILTSGRKEGFIITLARILIVSLLFGGLLSPSFFLSLGGGLAGTAVMALMAGGAWRFYSPLSMSVAGAFAHGAAQVAVLWAVLIRTWEVLYLLPWVLLPAVLSGIVTGLLANLVLVRRQEYLQVLGGMPLSEGRCPLVLASSSPRRKELIRRFGLPFIIRVPEVDESLLPGEEPSAHVRRLSILKAEASGKSVAEGFVVAADTVVVLDGSVIGKPSDRPDACRMLALLSGRTHSVYSGVTVARFPGGATRTTVVTSEVTMSPISSEEIRRYVDSGEPLDKAGAYAVQGKGGKYVLKVEGSLTNVIGLPLRELHLLMEEMGCAVSLSGREIENLDPPFAG